MLRRGFLGMMAAAAAGQVAAKVLPAPVPAAPGPPTSPFSDDLGVAVDDGRDFPWTVTIWLVDGSGGYHWQGHYKVALDGSLERLGCFAPDPPAETEVMQLVAVQASVGPDFPPPGRSAEVPIGSIRPVFSPEPSHTALPRTGKPCVALCPEHGRCP